MKGRGPKRYSKSDHNWYWRTLQKFLGNNNVISSRNDFDVFNLEVETESIVELTNDNSKIIRGICLLITNDKFDDTILTNDRQVRQLID